MKLPAFFSTLEAHYRASQKERSGLIHLSNEALNRSKRAIFALHRGDAAAAAALLKEARGLFEKVERSFTKHPELDSQGAYLAALEEYAEASLFLQYVAEGKFAKLEARAMSPSVFLGGLSDVTGEIVRYALRHATAGDFAEVKRANETVETLVAYLLELDLTGYLRQKFDQAKKNLHAIEQISYDASLKRRA